MTDSRLEKLKSCFYCSSDNIKILFSAPDRIANNPGEYFVSKCYACGLVFQNPRVKEEFISSYYNDEIGYFKPSTFVEHKKNTIKRFVHNKILINHFNYPIGKKSFFWKIITMPLVRFEKEIMLTPRYVERGVVLEIGCSHGARLKKIKEMGWTEVKGIEMNKMASDYAKKNGLDVENKMIEEAIFNNSSFDAIILSMVLEHLYDPFKKLKMITSWLKPGGQLIFSIPYFEGFQFKIFKNYSYSLHLPHHITFFNEKILKEYLSSLGYSKVDFYYQYNIRDIVASARYRHEDKGAVFYKFIHRNKVFAKYFLRPVIFILSLFLKTSRVTVYAQKSN